MLLTCVDICSVHPHSIGEHSGTIPDHFWNDFFIKSYTHQQIHAQVYYVIDNAVKEFAIKSGFLEDKFDEVAAEMKSAFPRDPCLENDARFFSRMQVRRLLELTAKKCALVQKPLHNDVDARESER